MPTLYFVRHRALLAAATILAGIVCLLAAPAADAAPMRAAVSAASLPGSVSASSYAGYLLPAAGSTIGKVGPLFPIALNCTQTTNSATSSGSSLALGTSAHAGAVSDQVSASRTATAVTAQASSHVQGLNILGGAITADGVNAAASSTASATSASSANTTTFSNLVVSGQAAPASPAPNTRINLSNNLGYVILNEQAGPSNSPNATTIQVTGMDVYITAANTFGLPIGSRIIIAHVYTSFSRSAAADVVASYAWGSYATGLTGNATSGPSAAIGVGCAGGSGTASTASTSVPLILSTGTTTDTAAGQVGATSSHASSQAQIQNANFLVGVLQAGTITAATTAQRDGSGGTATATTTLSNARLGGSALPVNPGPNTRVTIPGIGYAYLNEQSIATSATTARASVNAIDIFVTQTNTQGLPVGARIIIGHSQASVNA